MDHRARRARPRRWTPKAGVAAADLEQARARAAALASAWWIVLLKGLVAVSLIVSSVVVPDALLLSLSIACVAVYVCALFSVLRARAWLRAHPPTSG